MTFVAFKRFAFIALAAVAFSPLCHAQAQIVGDWQGVLSAGGSDYHIVLHLVAAKDGALSATVDNIDQGLMAIPASPVTLKDSKLSVTVDSFHGVYEGTLNKDATEIDGAWTADQPMDLNFKRVPATAASPIPAAAAPKPAAPQIAGDWEGMLNGQVHLILHFTVKDGNLTATLDSPDQGAAGIPITTVTLKDSKLTLAVDLVQGTYEGTVNNDATEIDGAWTQDQLIFKRVPAAAATPAPAAAASKPAPPS